MKRCQCPVELLPLAQPLPIGYDSPAMKPPDLTPHTCAVIALVKGKDLRIALQFTN